MDRLGRTDGRQVAVALVREDQVPGVEPLDGRCNGQRTAVLVAPSDRERVTERAALVAWEDG